MKGAVYLDGCEVKVRVMCTENSGQWIGLDIAVQTHLARIIRKNYPKITHLT